MPHLDIDHAARLVLGKYWRSATPEQRQRFVTAFQGLLSQSYGEALKGFTADRLTILPFHGNQNADQATVRTQVRRDNGSPLPIDYLLHKTPEGWKAWDITVDGISYVQAYRTDFASEIARTGLDATIQRIESQVKKS
jgi:phospholipid transport system substrate-binding protein